MKKVLILIFFLLSCGGSGFDFNGDLNLKKSLLSIMSPISNEKCNGDSVSFKLDTVTKFAWDKVYFFYGYGTTGQLIHRIGNDWKLEDFILNGYDNAFVFVKNGKVINHVGFKANRDEIVFENQADLKGFYTPENAIFTYKKICYGSCKGFKNVLKDKNK